jgi:hypothetical protein
MHVGRQLFVDGHHWQEEVFERLTNDWKAEERAVFHHTMLRLLKRSHDQEE